MLRPALALAVGASALILVLTRRRRKRREEQAATEAALDAFWVGQLREHGVVVRDRRVEDAEEVSVFNAEGLEVRLGTE